MDIELKKHLREKTEALHKLIRSLTPGQNVGLRPRIPPKRQKLYDVFRKMEEYDAKAIREAFPDDSHEALHRTKSILLNEVVKYIYEFQPANGKRDLWQLIGEAKHLRDIAADTIAMNRINAAIKLALGMEAMAELVDAIRLRRKLVEGLGDSEGIDFIALEDYALAGIEETARIDRLYSEVFRIRTLPAAEQLDQVAALEEKVAVTSQPKLVRNQLQVLNVKYYIQRKRGDVQAAIRYAHLIIELSESSPRILSDSDIRDVYFHAVNFLAVAYADLKDFGLAERYIEQIKDLAKVWGGGLEENPNLHARYIHASLAAKIALKDWKSAHEISKRVYRDVVQNNLLNNVRMQGSVLKLAAVTAFIVRDFSLARKLILFLRTSINSSNRIISHQHLAATIFVVTLLSYVEEADPHLRYSQKEMTTWLRSIGPVNAFETAVMRFFSQVGGGAEFEASPPMLLQLRSDLGDIFDDPQYRPYRDVFPLEAWIEAKLSGRDLREFDFD